MSSLKTMENVWTQSFPIPAMTIQDVQDGSLNVKEHKQKQWIMWYSQHSAMKEIKNI